jgi:hypothetical protein
MILILGTETNSMIYSCPKNLSDTYISRESNLELRIQGFRQMVSVALPNKVPNEVDTRKN